MDDFFLNIEKSTLRSQSVKEDCLQELKEAEVERELEEWHVNTGI